MTLQDTLRHECVMTQIQGDALRRQETSRDECQQTLNPKFQGSTPCASTIMLWLPDPLGFGSEQVQSLSQVGVGELAAQLRRN